MKAILGRKVGMTQVFEKNGAMTPVTVIDAGPCFVTQIRDLKKDGYEAIQMGFEECKSLNKPEENHLRKIGKKLRFLKEVRMQDASFEVITDGEEGTSKKEYKVGDKITADVFAEGDTVRVTGTSKGKGFAGVIKRHNFHRGPMSHGSHHHRAPGSIGAMYPQHVFKGKKMPGRMGNATVTTKNLKIVKIDAEKNLIAIKGAVPGPRKGLIIIKST